MARLWRIGAAGMVATFYAGRDKLVLDLDDTLFHKSGRKVAGAGNFRDPIRSRPPRIVYALGLNLVVLTLRVRGPWGGEPLGLPINCRLFHKGGGADHNELACEMLREAAGWFPDHRFVLCADGAFASLVADGLERTHLVSRMRRNAALYELPPPSTGRRGRPRKKGAHLPSLAELADRAPWQRAEIELRGKKTTRLVWSRPVLWYRVWPKAQVLLVIARDPDEAREAVRAGAHRRHRALRIDLDDRRLARNVGRRARLGGLDVLRVAGGGLGARLRRDD